MLDAQPYTVTLIGSGGKGTSLASYTYGVETELPTDWTKQCAKFEGWYTAQTGGERVTRISTTTLGDQSYKRLISIIFETLEKDNDRVPGIYSILIASAITCAERLLLCFWYTFIGSIVSETPRI